DTSPDDDTADDDTSPDDDNDDAGDDDDTSPDDDTADDDTSPDDDTADDDTGDDDTIDDDTVDDDTVDDDTGDDDTVDDDTIDDDTVDDDTVDDDTVDDDIVVEENEYIFGGVPSPFDIAAADDTSATISVWAGGRPFIYTYGEQDVEIEELDVDLKPVDIQFDPDGNLHVLAIEEGNTELKHLWRVDDTWHEETITGSYADDYSEMSIDADGHVHLCLGGWRLRYFTNASGEWTEEIVISTPLERIERCRIAASPDGKAYIAYREDWNDGHGHIYQMVKLISNTTGSWETTILTYYSNTQSADIAVDDADHVHVAYTDDTGLNYGYWDGTDWTFELVQPSYFYHDGIWLIDGKPMIICRDANDYELIQTVFDEGSWTVTPLGVITSYITEAIPTSTGQWRAVYLENDNYGLIYLNNLASEWSEEVVYQELKVSEPISSGIDDQGRRFFLVSANDGPYTATQTGDGWLIESLDLGISPIRNLQALTDDEGVTHLVGFSESYLVYANNQESDWQSELVEANIAYNHVFTILPNGEPAIAYCHSNNLHFAIRDDGDWTIEGPSADSINNDSYGIAANADGDVFICYKLLFSNSIQCARRHEGSWSTDTIESGLSSTRATSALAIDENGAPHFVYYAYPYTGGTLTRMAVFEDNEWSVTTIAEDFVYDARMIIDDQGVHHLALSHGNEDYLTYGTDVSGQWRFQNFAYVYFNYNDSLPPSLLPDGSVQVPYRQGSALWRAIIAPPNP
ncbi:MAG TPA: hypothetical protein PKW95_09560, partial [bacterium]|nr:hypothetical protein [bacterium]